MASIAKNRPAMPASPPPIVITEHEEEIFHVFRETLRANSLDTVLRVAGGWVRDKILGRESHDIDIAIDNMMGMDLAGLVNAYLESSCMEVHRIGVVAQNSDKSKHLETAKIVVCGQEIDLVNLRSEKYAQNSRIPASVAFGTPLEDALRRDFTINALFYNLTTREVEDFTGRGLGDLRRGYIVTPLDCRETFTDDPLRILRAIRFSRRLGFALDDSIVAALSNTAITERISLVSRQRYCLELKGMFESASPDKALADLLRFNLFEPIFLSLLRLSYPEANSGVSEQLATIGPRAVVLCKAAMQRYHSLRDDPHVSMLLLSGSAADQEARDCDLRLLVVLTSVVLSCTMAEPLRIRTDHLEDGTLKSHPVFPCTVGYYVARFCCAMSTKVATRLERIAELYALSQKQAVESVQASMVAYAYACWNTGDACVFLTMCAFVDSFKIVVKYYSIDSYATLEWFLSRKIKFDLLQVAKQLGIQDKTMYSRLKAAVCTHLLESPSFLTDTVSTETVLSWVNSQDSGELVSRL